MGPVPKVLAEEVGELCLAVVGRLLDLVDGSRFVIRGPRLRDHVAEHPGMHFHFSPDLVIGLGGRTRLEFVDGEITLERHETAVIPAGIPHREVPIAKAGEPFQNLVISIYNETICAQLQRTEPDAQTLGVERHYFDSSKDQLLIRYLEELSEQYHGRDLRRHYVIKGLMMAYLSTLAGILFLASLVLAYLGNKVVLDVMPIVYGLFAAAGLSLIHYLVYTKLCNTQILFQCQQLIRSEQDQVTFIPTQTCG
jgi:hypothetical protein